MGKSQQKPEACLIFDENFGHLGLQLPVEYEVFTKEQLATLWEVFSKEQLAILVEVDYLVNPLLTTKPYAGARILPLLFQNAS